MGGIKSAQAIRKLSSNDLMTVNDVSLFVIPV
jgi:hypothetical protein